MELAEIKLPNIPQWLAKAAIATVLGSVIWMASAYAQSGFITPSFVLAKVEQNHAELVDLTKRLVELQSRTVAILEQHEKRLERIERDK